ncbi:MAG: hypothetical protein HY231_12035 [Acidobacteria bacterium]|nr:hypothetical protein [Acidobacteriota bacterium]
MLSEIPARGFEPKREAAVVGLSFVGHLTTEDFVATPICEKVQGRKTDKMTAAFLTMQRLNGVAQASGSRFERGKRVCGFQRTKK